LCFFYFFILICREIYPVAKLNIMFENFENVLEVAENFLEELRSAKAKLGHICCIMYKKKDDFQKVRIIINMLKCV
jgi:hypothetical protein